MHSTDPSVVPDRPVSGDVSTVVRRFQVPAGISVTADVGGNPATPSVILLHGGGQTRHSWHGAMRELLRAGYHVINLDARGHGDSDWAPDGDYSLKAFSSDLQGVIAHLPTPPVLVGASMGGATALYATGNATAPIARALVLVDLVPRIDEAGARRIEAFMRAHPDGFATVEDAADAVAAYSPHRPRPRDVSGLMKNLRRHADGRLHWHWDPRLMQSRLRAEPPRFTDLLLDAARRITVPTLLVRGLQSDIVTDEGVAELRRCLPALEVADVAGAGHMVAGDKNDAFNDAVMGFLRRVHQPITFASRSAATASAS